jgi:hypothetical protein
MTKISGTTLVLLVCLPLSHGATGCGGCDTRLVGDAGGEETGGDPGADEGTSEPGDGDPGEDPEAPHDLPAGEPPPDGDEEAGPDLEPDGEVPEAETWVLTIGDGNRDGAVAVSTAADGNFLVAGSYYAHGAGSVLWIGKLGPDGSVLWQRLIGGRGDGYYEPLSMTQTPDGDIILAGRVNLFGDQLFDMWIVRLDASAAVIWQKSMGGTDHDAALDAVVTGDGGLVVCGRTASFSLGYDDVWVVGMDGSGAVLWQEALGGAGYDDAYAVTRTSGGEIVVVAETSSSGSGNPDLWLLFLDESGALLRQEALGGGEYDFGYDVLQSRDGGLVIAGSTLSFGEGFYDLWLVKTDILGSILWQETMGGGDTDGAASIVELADGNLLVAGSAQSFGRGEADAWILQLDPDGSVTRQRTLGSEGYDGAASVAEGPDGSIVIAGQTNGLGEGAMDILAAGLPAEGNPGDCSLLADSAVTPRPSGAVARDTDAEVRPTDAVAADTPAEVLDFDDSPLFHCPE